MWGKEIESVPNSLCDVEEMCIASGLFSCPIKIITNVQLSVKNQRASPEKSGFFAARMSEVLKPHPRTEAISQVSTFLSRMS